jgi:hypothetical protein
MTAQRRHASPDGGKRQQDAIPSQHSSDELPLGLQWFSEERIQESIRVWSKEYGRPISRDEAIEILTNVRRFAEIIVRAEAEKNAERHGSPLSRHG